MAEAPELCVLQWTSKEIKTNVEQSSKTTIEKEDKTRRQGKRQPRQEYEWTTGGQKYCLLSYSG
jgi:hypothetical protein